MKNKRKIKINDTVMVISGKEKNKISTILGFTKKNNVLLKGLNKKNVFVSRRVEEEGKTVLKKVMINKESGLDISNVVLYDKKNSKKVKISYKKTEKGKIRINKNTGLKI